MQIRSRKKKKWNKIKKRGQALYFYGRGSWNSGFCGKSAGIFGAEIYSGEKAFKA
jgi:hypothetical protein